MNICAHLAAAAALTASVRVREEKRTVIDKRKPVWVEDKRLKKKITCSRKIWIQKKIHFLLSNSERQKKHTREQVPGEDLEQQLFCRFQYFIWVILLYFSRLLTYFCSVVWRVLSIYPREATRFSSVWLVTPSWGVNNAARGTIIYSQRFWCAALEAPIWRRSTS